MSLIKVKATENNSVRVTAADDNSIDLSVKQFGGAFLVSGADKIQLGEETGSPIYTASEQGIITLPAYPVVDQEFDSESENAQSGKAVHEAFTKEYITSGKLQGSSAGIGATIEGNENVAAGEYSHAEGSFTIANGDSSHAEGYNTVVNGYGSHTEGIGTTGSADYSHVQGKYNIEDTENTYAHVVGNGESDTERSNAHTLDWEGNAWYAGKVSQTEEPTKKDDLATVNYVNEQGSHDEKVKGLLKEVTIPATLTDSDGDAIRNLKVAGTSFQDGTPTPTAPIDIENTGDTLKLTSCGKNLFDKTSTVDGYVSDTTGNVADAIPSSLSVASDYIPATEGSTLFVPPQSERNWQAYYDSDKVYISGFAGYGARVIPSKAAYIRVTVLKTNVDTFQLEFDSTATSYEPYSGNTYTIPLTDTDGVAHTMRQYDEVKKHGDGKWYFDCNSNLVSFDGTESYTLVDLNTFGVRCDVILPNMVLDRNNFITGLCSHNPVTNSYMTSYDSKGNRLEFRQIVANWGISEYTVDAWRAQLVAWNTAGDPLTVLYQTATTTSYELSAETSQKLESIYSQKGICNIYFTNTVPPSGSFEYVQELEESIVDVGNEYFCKIVENSLTTPATIKDSNGGKLINEVVTGNSTQNGTPTPTTPIEIQNTGDTLKLMSCGEISSILPIGSEITINRGNNPIVWRVVDYNHFDLASGKTEPMLTLEMKNVYGSGTAYKQFVFDAPEALYYAEEALSAGTYHFTFNYSLSSVVSGTYQFTLTQAVPAGGQIILGTHLDAIAITDCKISTYSEIGGTAAIESNIDVTAGSDGTDLGITGSGNLNHPHRILWGSNNYAQSALRQWLNSSADLGSVWTPTNKFDRAPSWNTSTDTAYKGFMLGFDSDFLGAIQAAVIPCHTNSVYEVNSTDGSEFAINQVYNLEDKFFLLSRPEMYGTWDSTTYKDGELLDFYDGLTDTERKKFDAFGSVQFAWLRSPSPSHAYYERIVYTDGRLSGTITNNSIGVAAACMISVANMAELINNGKATYSALDNIETYTIPLTDINGTSHIMRQYDVVKKHDDGKWYFDCNSSIKEFDGTENWFTSSIGSTDGTLSRFYTPVSDRKLDIDTTNIQLLSNYLLSTSYKDYTATSTNSSNAISANTKNNAIFIKISTSIINENSISTLKSQLAAWNTSGNPLTVLYQTATTTSYELNATAQTVLNSIAIQKGNANIYFTNAVAPGMTADYPLDLKLYMDNKFAELQAQIIGG